MGIEASSLRPLVLAAMTLVGEYAQAIDSPGPCSAAQMECAQHDLNSMGQVVTQLIAGWKELEEIYLQLLRRTLETDQFDEDTFARISQFLKLTRGLEITLKAATPPQELAGSHMAFRRAVASARSRLADLDSLYRQTKQTGNYVDTHIDLDALKDLAEFTTAGLARIA